MHDDELYCSLLIGSSIYRSYLTEHQQYPIVWNASQFRSLKSQTPKFVPVTAYNNQLHQRSDAEHSHRIGAEVRDSCRVKTRPSHDDGTSEQFSEAPSSGKRVYLHSEAPLFFRCQITPHQVNFQQ